MGRKIIEDIRPNKKKKIPLYINEDVLHEKSIKTNFSEDLVIIGEEIKENTKEFLMITEDQAIIQKNNEEGVIKRYFKRKNIERHRLQRTPQIKTKQPILHKLTLVVFIFTIIICVIYWGGNIFQNADIVITSKHQLIAYKNKQFTATKDQDEDLINFEIMITSDKRLKSISLSESKNVSIKSQGSITLYNEFGTTSQKLLAGTFISDNNGKAYKIDTAVTIPGYKLDNNKKIIPGQADVNITAFLPGEAYNGNPSDFYINSFKNTKKYIKIYGKLKNPLEGGASGIFYSPSDQDIIVINNIAQSSFKNDLLNQVRSLVPPGYILYSNTLNFSYKIADNILSKTSEAEIEMEGTIAVVILKEQSLIDNIIRISLPNIKDKEAKEIKLSGLDSLLFNFTNKEEIITKDMSSVSFSFSGDIDAIWNPDVELLRAKLAGTLKNDVMSIFRQDPGIASAIVKVSPPWYKYIPDDISKINIMLK